MAIDHRQVHFRTNDISEVTDEMLSIIERGNGREWITISPWVDPEHVPVVSVLRQLMSARGSKVPEVTWVPAQDNEPAQLGFAHSRGPNAYELLASSEVAIPSTWVKVSDHSKRGLLFAVHPDASVSDIIWFTIAASEALAEVPTDDRWIAQVSTSKRK